MEGDKKRVLLVEDDKNLGLLLSGQLEDTGFLVKLAHNGKEGLGKFNSEPFDIALIDVMMPEKDGFQLAHEIRLQNSKVPFIFITARSLKVDKLTGYRLGCDDYVTKPFDFDELVARVKAVLRRAAGDATELVEEMNLGDLSMHRKERVLVVKNERISLSTKEAGILNLLFDNQNQLVSRSDILKKVWGMDDIFTSKSLDVYLTKLRKYLKQSDCVKMENVHGLGYRLIEATEVSD